MSRRRRRKEAKEARKAASSAASGGSASASASASVEKEIKKPSEDSASPVPPPTAGSESKSAEKSRKKDGAVKKKEVKPVAAGVPGWVQWLVILVLVAGLGYKLFTNESPRRRESKNRRIRDDKPRKKESKADKKTRASPAEVIGPLELGFHSDCGKGFTIERFQVYTAFYGQGDKAGWKRKDFKTNKRDWKCSASNPKSKKGQKLSCEAGDDKFGFKFSSKGTGKKFVLEEFRMDGLNMITEGVDFSFAYQSSNTVSTFNRALKDSHFYMKETRPGKSHQYIMKKNDDVMNIEIEADCPMVLIKEDAPKSDDTSPNEEKEL